MRYKMEKHFVNVLSCDLDSHLGNGIVGGAAPPKKVSKKQEFDL